VTCIFFPNVHIPIFGHDKVIGFSDFYIKIPVGYYYFLVKFSTVEK